MDVARIKEQVWQVVQAMNRIWAVEGKVEGLEEYFHENMVSIIPTDHDRHEGREECIAAWKIFVDSVTMHDWKEINPRVDLYGNGQFAVVAYYFEGTFDMGGRTLKTTGRDLMTLVNENGKWWIVSDQFSPYPRSGKS